MLRRRLAGNPVQFVEHGKRPFAFTVGLHNRGLPELLITGAGRFLIEVVEVEHPDVHLKFAVMTAAGGLGTPGGAMADAGSRCSECAAPCPSPFGRRRPSG